MYKSNSCLPHHIAFILLKNFSQFFYPGGSNNLLFLLHGLRDKHGFFFLYSAAVNSETREEVAIKKISNAFDNRIDAKRTLREIKLLHHMDHENVSSVSFFLL